jgi:hypothetical protein
MDANIAAPPGMYFVGHDITESGKMEDGKSSAALTIPCQNDNVGIVSNPPERSAVNA